MVYKKKCICGYLLIATSKAGVQEALKDHCEHTKCEATNAKDA